ncbi:hypothetical protein HIM_00542 [Hirsutella minnesotensis 3608]|nr:hypothetical protein HIM_00542 [Hirsutella minnesotensis 3608]
MPKKRHHVKSFKPFSRPSAASSASTPRADKTPASVNQLLANLRRTSIAPSPTASVQAAPSLPPAIREALQLPETPAPLPRRPARRRYDDHGRRLPAGPAPPRSWTLRAPGETGARRFEWATSERARFPGLALTTLPGVSLPERGSLIDLVLRRIALDWTVHRHYNQYYLYSVPSHLKHALIRYIGVASDQGVTIADLKAILLPMSDVYDDDDIESAHMQGELLSNSQVTCLDLSGSTARSFGLRELSRLLFPPSESTRPELVHDSWDTTDLAPSPPRVLLPTLTHLSLALRPDTIGQGVSWKQLLALSSKLSAITHLSLAFWPTPCLKANPGHASFLSPHGAKLPSFSISGESGSHDDWSEALLVLRLLSRNLYRLEYLDLTGCASWWQALTLESGHDFVDWTWSWGKMNHLRLFAGWTPGLDATPADVAAHTDAAEMARRVERHIIARRAGKAMPITVERDKTDQ